MRPAALGTVAVPKAWNMPRRSRGSRSSLGLSRPHPALPEKHVASVCPNRPHPSASDGLLLSSPSHVGQNVRNWFVPSANSGQPRSSSNEMRSRNELLLVLPKSYATLVLRDFGTAIRN